MFGPVYCFDEGLQASAITDQNIRDISSHALWQSIERGITDYMVRYLLSTPRTNGRLSNGANMMQTGADVRMKRRSGL